MAAAKHTPEPRPPSWVEIIAAQERLIRRCRTVEEIRTETECLRAMERAACAAIAKATGEAS